MMCYQLYEEMQDDDDGVISQNIEYGIGDRFHKEYLLVN